MLRDARHDPFNLSAEFTQVQSAKNNEPHVRGIEGIMAVKKGNSVRLVLEAFENSLESLASDRRLPPYVFDGTGEVVEIRGEYAQVKFRVPTPNVWLPLNQLEAV